MPLNRFGLGFEFSAVDVATPVIRQVDRTFAAATASMRSRANAMMVAMAGAAAGAASLAAGFAGLRGAFAAARVSAEFEQGLARVGALTRATARDMDRLKEAAIAAGIATQFSPAEAVEGLAELGVRGFDATQSVQALTGVLDLAAGGSISVAQAAQTVGAALRVFGLSADRAGFAVDRLLRISNLTALQANELAHALGNVSRGAGVTGQSLEEMLPAIGLVRNTGVEASVAANAVSSALLFMARNAEKFRAIGVAVTDAQGRFRPFLDVILETREALGREFANDAERTAIAMDLFGRFGIVAFQGISQQLTTGVRDATGALRTGADAVALLRDQMRDAGGAAEEFRRRMLDTFRGQLVLLRGTVETLQVVFGAAFARVFRPFVEALTTGLNRLIRVWESFPEGVKTGVAALVVMASAGAVALGGLVAAGFGVVLILPILKGVAIAVGALAATFAPLVAGAGAAVAAFFTLREAARRNLGGLGDFVERTVGKVSLAWRALAALFTEGEISGPIVAELGRAENRGVLRFVDTASRAFARVEAFLRGVRAAFAETFRGLGPVFAELRSSLEALGREFGFLGDALGDFAARGLDETERKGRTFGAVLGRALGLFVRGLSLGVKAATVFVAWARRIWRGLAPVREIVNAAGRELVRAFGNISEALTTLGLSSEKGTGAAGEFGRTLGDVVVPVLRLALLPVQALALGVRAVAGAFNAAMDAAAALGRAVGLMGLRISVAWDNAVDRVRAAALRIVGLAAKAAEALPAGLRELVGLGGVNLAAAGGALEARAGALEARAGAREAALARVERTLTAPAEARVRGEGRPAATQAETLRALVREATREAAAGRPIRVQTVVQLDRREIARAIGAARADEAADAFAPLEPAGEGI